MHIFKRGVKEMRKKVAALAAVAIVLVSLGAGSTAEAGWGSIIGAGIQIGVQYAQIDKAMKYYDGEGRGEFFEMMKEKYGVNEDEELNARLDVIMANLSDAIAKIDPSIKDKPYNYFIIRGCSILWRMTPRSRSYWAMKWGTGRRNMCVKVSRVL